jgi:renalase
MTTTHSRLVEGAWADSGAQFLFQPPGAGSSFNNVWQELLRHGVLVPMNAQVIGDTRPASPAAFVSPSGLSAVPSYLLKRVECQLSTKLTALTQSAGPNGTHRWCATVERPSSSVGQVDGLFDSVFLTMPVPQMLQLGGDAVTALVQAGLDVPLRRVRYSSCYALIAHFAGQGSAAAARAALPYGARYVSRSECADGAVYLISVDSEKRGALPDAPTSIVVHSNSEFGERHVDSDVDTAVTPRMLSALAALHPSLPTPTDVRCHRWRYSQVTQAFAGCNGAILVDAGTAPLILCGDAFAESNFAGCVRSATAALRLWESALGALAGPQISAFRQSL